MNSPFVSVVIPTYNRAECIKEAIDSVLNQSFQDFELIVVDDGSTDNTHEIVGAYGSRVNYFKQENHGAAHARNSGVKVAKGEWVAFLDSDDLWKQDKLKIQVEDISKYPGIVAHMVDAAIECFPNSSLFEIRGLRSEFKKNPFRKRPLCDVLEAPFFTPCWMVLRETIIDAGMFNSVLKIFEDFNLLTRVALEGPFCVNCYVGAVVRRKISSAYPLSNLYQKSRTSALSSLIYSYTCLKTDPRLDKKEYNEIKKRLGGIQCELFDQYKKKNEWRKGFKILLRSMIDDPGIRSFLRAGCHLIGLADSCRKIKNIKEPKSSFRRSDIDFSAQ